MQATKFDIILIDIRNQYNSDDYKLAEMDGRLTVLKPKKESTPSEAKPKKEKTEDISILIERMNSEQREELLQQLLK